MADEAFGSSGAAVVEILSKKKRDVRMNIPRHERTATRTESRRSYLSGVAVAGVGTPLGEMAEMTALVVS